MTREKKTNKKDYFEHGHVTTIVPRHGWHMLNLRELWAYRELVWVLTLRDVRVRYKQTVLGAGWAVIRPVMAMAIFTVVFGRLAQMPSEGIPYPVFVYSGLLPWTFFAAAVSASANSLVGSQQLVSKVYFPRLIIPLSSVGSGLVDLLIATVVLLVLMLFYGVPLSKTLLLTPVLFLSVTMAALGVGTLLSALNVAYRDFRHIEPFLVQIWMYVSPVIYPVTLIPEKWRWLIYLNPMSGLIEAFRAVFLQKPVDFVGLGISCGVGLAIFVFGIAYFERVERRFADIV